MIGGMSRWEPGARGRLEQAALELYIERGFEQTTVAEIARRAGLTERTFFRYFADKREVLFWGAGTLQELLVSAVASAPDSQAPIDAIAAALESAGALFQERREHSRQRQAVIAANTGLQERELIKLASLSAALADTLRRRGVKDPAASLAAEAGIAVFKIAFERWINETSQPDLPRVIRESLDELRAVTAGNGGSTTTAPGQPAAHLDGFKGEAEGPGQRPELILRQHAWSAGGRTDALNRGVQGNKDSPFVVKFRVVPGVIELRRGPAPDREAANWNRGDP
jgi:AcrR family transcriptional regulator